jgi:hypothetical protein
MHRLLPLALIACAAACAPPLYVQPSIDDPHGTVKVRMVYHEAPRTHLAERVVIDESRIEGRFRPSRDTRVMPVRVAPGAHRWRIRAVFSHQEQRRVQENVQERYMCGTEQVNGISRTKYCTRNRTRWVTRLVTVNDGSCQVDQSHVVRQGVSYIAQFDYFGHRRCTLRYLEQRTRPDGSFDLVPAS